MPYHWVELFYATMWRHQLLGFDFLFRVVYPLRLNTSLSYLVCCVISFVLLYIKSTLNSQSIVLYDCQNITITINNLAAFKKSHIKSYFNNNNLYYYLNSMRFNLMWRILCIRFVSILIFIDLEWKQEQLTRCHLFLTKNK